MPTSTVQALTPGQAQQLIADDATLVVDVRSPGEFASAHIKDAINIPVDQVDAHLQRIVNAGGGTLLLVCQSGGRADLAADKLTDGGHSDLTVLAGGMGAWTQAGLPVEHAPAGEEKWALERQVRLVAGSIALSSVLASTVAPKAKWGAAFIGGGLTFAAVSNTCMMGNLLSRLPYNQGPGCDIDAAITRLERADGRG